jgi:hypothetical protein
MTAEATHYRESLALELQMKENPEFRDRWTAAEAAYEARMPIDDEVDDIAPEDELSTADAVSI